MTAIGRACPSRRCRPAGWRTAEVTVDAVEEQTGLDFFAPLPDGQEETMESRLMAMW